MCFSCSLLTVVIHQTGRNAPALVSNTKYAATTSPGPNRPANKVIAVFRFLSDCKSVDLTNCRPRLVISITTGPFSASKLYLEAFEIIGRSAAAPTRENRPCQPEPPLRL
ncbi:hypothetical protein GWI33_012627 [Rhynchophorus ferrugineus]|uniref:Uncharacterized protein n=1 Tax=Rhynchophorus ferrugineus TaxID=354439 RepID=A0A834I8X2_RHYFE|nr:hypothetical protein GWI33_012627 [Rhynchophorus ferrugineus]